MMSTGGSSAPHDGICHLDSDKVASVPKARWESSHSEIPGDCSAQQQRSGPCTKCLRSDRMEKGRTLTPTSKQLHHEKTEITRRRLPPSLVTLNRTKTKRCLLHSSPINWSKVRKSHLGCGCSRAPNRSLREVMSRTCLSALL